MIRLANIKIFIQLVNVKIFIKFIVFSSEKLRVLRPDYFKWQAHHEVLNFHKCCWKQYLSNISEKLISNSFKDRIGLTKSMSYLLSSSTKLNMAYLCSIVSRMNNFMRITYVFFSRIIAILLRYLRAS